jgi:hypothetical protein
MKKQTGPLRLQSQTLRRLDGQLGAVVGGSLIGTRASYACTYTLNSSAGTDPTGTMTTLIGTSGIITTLSH